MYGGDDFCGATGCLGIISLQADSGAPVEYALAQAATASATKTHVKAFILLILNLKKYIQIFLTRAYTDF